MFTFKSFQKTVADMVTYVSANSLINDTSPGSVFLTITEAVAQEIYQQYIQLVNVIQAYNIDTATGSDLDNKALEYGLVRLAAEPASGYVTISDSSFTKISTNIFAGTSGAVIGQVTLDINDASTFTPTGTVIVGRDTGTTVETVNYTSITDNTTYYTLNLDAGTPLVYNHKIGETVILSQGGLRTVNAGTVVYIPETNISLRVNYILNSDAVLADGEDEVTNISVTALTNGEAGNASIGGISIFEVLPFSSALVTNPEAFTNGQELETDAQLRDRIRNYIQSLSRGTETAIITLISGLTNDEQTKRVVSANFLESINPLLPNTVYIDDGVGYEVTYQGKATEYVIRSAAGTEKFVQLENFPLVKGVLVTINSQPYNIQSGDKLRVAINDVEQEIIFVSTDFTSVGAVTAREVAIAINDRMSLVEARTVNGSTKVILQARAETNEHIKIIMPNTGVNANDVLNFESDKYSYTLKLYKNDVLMNKDGLTAFVDTGTDAPFALADGDTLRVIVDNKINNIQLVTFDMAHFVDITAATTQEVADEINLQLPGAYAESILDDSKVRIYSRTETSADSYIQVMPDSHAFLTDGQVAGTFTVNSILGLKIGETVQVEDSDTSAIDVLITDITGASTPYTIEVDNGLTDLSSYTVGNNAVVWVGSANTSNKLDFPTTLVEGKNNDYILNRFNGQIELSNPLIVGDIVAAGTVNTEAFLETVSPENYDIGAGEILVFSIDGTANQTYTFAAGPYTAQNIATLINSDLSLYNVHCYTVDRGSDTYLRIATNTLDGTGTIEIDSSSTATALDFVYDTVSDSEDANLAFAEPQNVRPYTLSPGQNLVVILDNDPLNRVFNLVFSLTGTVTNSIANNNFDSTNIRNNYSNDNDFFNGYIIKFSNTTTTPALRGYTRMVADYNGTTGNILLSDILPAVPNVADSFDLIPTNAASLTYFLNNTDISSFSIYSDIRLIKNSTKFQIATQTEGSDGGVQITGGSANSILIPFTEIGGAGGDFKCASIDGLVSGVGDLVGANTYIGGTKIILDNVLNTYTYNFVSNGTAGGQFNCNDCRRLHIGDGVVIKSTAVTTYLNGYIDDIGGVGFEPFLSTGTSAGTFTVNSIAALAVNQKVVIKDSTTNAYTNGYIFSLSAGPAPYTVTIYDFDTSDVVDLSSFTTGDGAAVYYAPFTVDIFDRTTALAHDISAFLTADTAQISSIYDKGYVQNIAGVTAPYTVTIYDEDSLTIVDTLESYTTDYGAVLKDRNGFNFTTNAIVGIDGYKNYTGLLQKVQWKIDGLDSDPVNYPGIKAAGIKIGVSAPVIRPIKLALNITTQGDVTLGSIEPDIKTAVSKYINGLKVGEDVVISAIEAGVRQLINIYDVQVISPTTNIVIADNELARVDSRDITLS